MFIDGNLQKPLVDADGCVYKWGVIVRLGTGKFSSIAVGTDNLAFKNGVKLNFFPTYFAPSASANVYASSMSRVSGLSFMRAAGITIWENSFWLNPIFRLLRTVFMR